MSVLAGFNGNFWGCWQGVSQSSKVFEEGVSIIEGAEHAPIFEGVGISFFLIYFLFQIHFVQCWRNLLVIFFQG